MIFTYRFETEYHKFKHVEYTFFVPLLTDAKSFLHDKYFMLVGIMSFIEYYD